uniref:Uncharacterized protein n=1 Tax=Anguilla anguilla TaxID=7936 RepID=A0A0E9R2T8_ANGAN
MTNHDHAGLVGISLDVCVCVRVSVLVSVW